MRVLKSSSAENWNTPTPRCHVLHDVTVNVTASGGFASGSHSRGVSSQSHSDTNTLCSRLPLCLPLCLPPLSLFSVRLSRPALLQLVFTHVMGLTRSRSLSPRTRGRGGQERRREGRMRPWKKMGEEEGEEGREARKKEGDYRGEGLRGRRESGVPEKENKCVEERKRGGRALSISLLLGYGRSRGTFQAHLNFGEEKLHLHTVTPTRISIMNNFLYNSFHINHPELIILGRFVKAGEDARFSPPRAQTRRGHASSDRWVRRMFAAHKRCWVTEEQRRYYLQGCRSFKGAALKMIFFNPDWSNINIQPTEVKGMEVWLYFVGHSE